VARCARRRYVPVASRPESPLRIDGQVLGDVAPVVLLHVELAHGLDGGQATEVLPAGPPCVVHVNRSDSPCQLARLSEECELRGP